MQHIKRGENSIRIEEGPWAIGMGAMFTVLGTGAATGAAMAIMSETARMVGVLAVPISAVFLLIGLVLLRRGRRVIVVDGATRTIDTGSGTRSFDELSSVVLVRQKAAVVTSGRILHWVELRFEDGASLRVDSDTVDSEGSHARTLARDIGAIVGIDPTGHEDG